MTPLQATCVAIAGRGVLITGRAGSGKSSLALALIDRGAELVGDDAVMIEARGGLLVARPHPGTVGLIEVRNVGLVPMPTRDQVPVALAVALDPAAPRYVERAESERWLDVAIPRIRLWPDSPVLAIRTELALARYGLPGGRQPA